MGKKTLPADARELKSIADLQPDPKNANKGTERGLQLVEDSLAECGAGRSIVVDKAGVTIGGAKTLEAAAAAGMDIIVVPSDGKQLVVVQRTDLDIKKDAKAKKLAILDNRTAELGLDWDPNIIAELENEDPDILKPGFLDFELDELLARATIPDEDETDAGGHGGMPQPTITYNLVFDTEAQQQLWYGFLRWLKKEFPKSETIGSRLAEYIREKIREVEPAGED